ncbi:MAG: hypothetical protein VB078_07760 [Clostridiaceae bacterium]|nr:hypothetical protein [Clostridiaceae bacterium]
MSTDYMEQYVPVRLFKDNDKYSDDVFVAVNGEGCLIKRGDTVMVKRKFAEVLEQSDRQDMYTSNLMDERSGEYERMSKVF